MKKNEKTKEKIIQLPPTQLHFLNLFIFGYRDRVIFEILGVTPKKGREYKYLVYRKLKKKFGAETWTDIIKESFKNGLLNEQDFVNRSVKAKANHFANKIYSNGNEFKGNSVFYELSGGIEKDILNFLSNCEGQVLSEKAVG